MVSLTVKLTTIQYLLKLKKKTNTYQIGKSKLCENQTTLNILWAEFGV